MSWLCPHCNTAAIMDKEDFVSSDLELKSGGNLYNYRLQGVTCPNPSCQQATLILQTYEVYYFQGSKGMSANNSQARRLIPSTEKIRAQNYPAYIPSSILSDYREACAIVSLSPKASATLARRCLQGMIRDFWGVSGKSLHHEILAIEDKVDPVVWEAILDVKSIGNIGAHMEKDINLIVDVSAEEADLLIEMIEMLLDDWYVARHEKQQKLQRIKEVAAEKAEARKG
ncbi:TPA: DUF4145 domain-containing protein [Escherichia coli]